MLSLIFAFVLYALFEAPSVNLCKLAFKRNKPLKVPKDLNNNSNGHLTEMAALKQRISANGEGVVEEESDENQNIVESSHSKSS